MSAVAIVGGGLAGGAAATLLAQAGHTVQLLERETAPTNKICGEFLSIEAQHSLARLGLDLAQFDAPRIDRLRLVSGDRVIEAALPFVALGLSRRRLDAALLDHAAAAGARIERGVTVRGIADGRIETTHGPIAAPTLMIASGKHDLRGIGRDTSGCDTGYVGFKTYWRLPPRERTALDGAIEVVLFDGGYAGLQLIEGGRANLCLLIRKSRLAALGGTWPALLATLLDEPHLRRRLGDAEELLPRPLTIAGVPYGYLRRPDEAGPASPFHLGDQAAVIPSFSGDGMAIALHSAARAAQVLAGGGDARAYHLRLDRDLAGQIRLALRLQHWGERRVPRALLWGLLRLAPSLATYLAGATRIRPHAKRALTCPAACCIGAPTPDVAGAHSSVAQR